MLTDAIDGEIKGAKMQAAMVLRASVIGMDACCGKPPGSVLDEG